MLMILVVVLLEVVMGGVKTGKIVSIYGPVLEDVVVHRVAARVIVYLAVAVLKMCRLVVLLVLVDLF